MKNLLLSACLLLAFNAQAQVASPPDVIKTKKGDLTVQPLMHATLALQWNKKVIWVDPAGGAKLFEGAPAPDLILITDIHGDHFDLKTLQALNITKAKIIAPKAVADKMPEALKARTIVLANGQKTKRQSISVLAVPMYNLPETPEALHPKGRGNGYVLSLGGKKVYLSGDTEDIQEMRQLTDIDVAFVCMNLPYTMQVDQAADAVLAFKPAIVYPYHYRGQNGLSDVEAFKQKVNAGNTKIEVRLKNWYQQ